MSLSLCRSPLDNHQRFRSEGPMVASHPGDSVLSKETEVITERKHRHDVGEAWHRENLGSMCVRSLEGHPGESALVREPWERDRDVE